jgi:hypothetical protein
LLTRRLAGVAQTPSEAPLPIARLAHADLADCIHHVLALRDQNIDLPELRDGLYRFLAITVLLISKTCLKSDHFNGGGST